MAWTEQCKLVFKSNADALIWKQKGRKNKTAVIRQLGKDTGIPFETLKRWYYEKENRVKNDTHQSTTQNNKKKPIIKQIKRAKDGTLRGGPRKGAGRPPKEKQGSTKQDITQRIRGVSNGIKNDVISDEFKESFNQMIGEIQNAREGGWETTSKESVLKHLKSLINIITIGGQ